MVEGVPARTEGEPSAAWHQPELILLDSSGFGRPYPLFLDVVNEGVLLYDVGGFTSGALSAMREKFNEMGAARTQLPDGTWYWALLEA